MVKAEAPAKTATAEAPVSPVAVEPPKSEPLVPLTAEEVAATDAPNDGPRTPEELGARLEKLLDDAKADGLARPLLQEIGAVYAKKGLAIAREGFSLIDDFLEYFLGNGTRKKS